MSKTQWPAARSVHPSAADVEVLDWRETLQPDRESRLSHRERTLARFCARFDVSRTELQGLIEQSDANELIVDQLCQTPAGRSEEARLQRYYEPDSHFRFPRWHRSARGRLAAELERIRFWLSDGVILAVFETVDQQLFATDLPAMEICSAWPVPHQATYIAFPGTLHCTPTPNGLDGRHFAGVYVRATSGAAEEAIISPVVLEPHDPRSSLLALPVMRSPFRELRAGIDALQRIQGTSRGNVAAAEGRLLTQVAKVLLYCGSVNARLVHEDAHSSLLQAVHGGGKKAAKRWRAANRAIDCIRVEPPNERCDEYQANLVDATSSRSCHWRRGHFRNQPCGVGRQQVRVVWISPAIVNEELGIPPSKKDYLLP